LKQLYRRAVFRSDGLSCVSTRLKKHVISQYSRTKPVTVITNAVDTESFRPLNKKKCREMLGLPTGAIIVGTAGDLSQGRGSEIIFEALKKHPDAFQNIHIAVAGYRSADTTLPKSDRVHDLGVLSSTEVPMFLNTLDLGVVYNRKTLFGEFCFPQKLYEFAACDCPLLAAAIGEVGDLLEDYPDLLYPESDTKIFTEKMCQQLSVKTLLPLTLPSWQNQAKLLEEHVQTVRQNV
ncbi:MAG: glycosyltransferase, partial [bacterium]